VIRNPASAFRLRFAVLMTLLALTVAGSTALAIISGRVASHTIGRLADVELESALLARQFRTTVDELHSALLRIGSDPADDSKLAIEQGRRQLAQWLAQRTAAERNRQEHGVLQQLAVELGSYYRKLDDVAARVDGYATPLDRAEIASFDDMAVRLQSLADDFDAIHDAEERELLEASLGEVRRLRDLVLSCVVLFVAATGALAVLLYREVVFPLRAQLVARDALLARREKLAALGTLAAGVAHEIRNPLTAIKARLYILRRAAVSPETQGDVQAVAGEIDRLEAIVRDVLGYARPGDPELAEVDLAAWLREFGAFVEPELKAGGVQLDIEVAVPLTARVDSSQLRQAVLNLVRNAQESFAGRPGRIVLTATREFSALLDRPCDVAVVSVADNGPGIPTGIQSRLFDPFFTTKRAGTGLGLSIVARLVEGLGGEIVFQTAPGVGTRFSIRLPVDGKVPDTGGK
jgi:signal transduction histidine kinase